MKTARKLTALLLCLCMMIGMPLPVQAAETTEDVFEVTHVVEMPDWMAQNEADKGRTLLVYFNSNPTSAPTGWRLFVSRHVNDTDPLDRLAWGKYNSSYAFSGHNPIAVTMMTQEEADASGYTNPTGRGYAGTLKEFLGTNANHTLHVVFGDQSASTETWDGYLNDSFVNENGTRIKSNQYQEDGTPMRQNGYAYRTPAVEDALTLKKVIKTGENTLTAEFSEPIDTTGFGTDWNVSLNVTNNNGDLMQTKEADTYDGATGISGTFYQKDAVSIVPESDGSSRYVITFADGAITEIQSWLDMCNSGRNDRNLRLRIYDKISAKINCFVDSVKATDGNPLLISWKRIDSSTGLANIKIDDYEYYSIMEAAIGSTRYSTLEKAMAAAADGKTVLLQADVDKSLSAMVKVPAGVTLDLNGKELTADMLIAFGYVTDSSEGEGGAIISNDPSKAVVHLQVANPALPLYDAADGCYRFFNYTFTNLGTKDGTAESVKFGVNLTFNSAVAYTLLAEDANDGTTVEMPITVNEKTISYCFTAGLYDTYAAVVLEDYDNRANQAFTLTVYGLSSLEAGSELSVAPVLDSGLAVAKTAEAKTYTIPEE